MTRITMDEVQRQLTRIMIDWPTTDENMITSVGALMYSLGILREQVSATVEEDRIASEIKAPDPAD